MEKSTSHLTILSKTDHSSCNYEPPILLFRFNIFATKLLFSWMFEASVPVHGKMAALLIFSKSCQKLREENKSIFTFK